MGSFGWLIGVIAFCGMTLLCVILSAVIDIRNGFSTYSDNELSLKTKRFTVYPLIYVAVVLSLWIITCIAGSLAVLAIILGLIVVLGFYVAVVFLFPISLYGLILAVALKKRKINKYAGSTYIVCSIISILISLLMIGVIIAFALRLV
jgi:hypothetical protein